jgi:hypothetical protein
MEVLKILDKPDTIDWEYDEEADVLYLSVGTPKPAVGVDIGEGLSCAMMRPTMKWSALQYWAYVNA